jgi:superfamily I DNA/RNA helicase
MKQAHIPILHAFDELKFNLGKKTFADFIKGDINPTIEKNNLEELESYGSLFMIEKTEIYKILDQLLKHNYLQIQTVGTGFQVITRTSQGIKEIYERKFEISDVKEKKAKTKKVIYQTSPITQKDKELFGVFDFFLKGYNDEQKKSIICDSKNILCIAGAGSGKTTVLTKRIQFLSKFKSVKENKILAITFTRKAKEEMLTRLHELEINNAVVETFNSFCEKILKKYQNKIYKDQTNVAQFRDKISIVKTILNKKSISFETIIDDYFNKKQIRQKSHDELFLTFVSDIFSIVDFYKILKDNNDNKQTYEIKPFYERERNPSKRRVAKQIYEVAIEIDKELKKRNLRDFTDQVLETIKLFQNNHDLIPKYNHILVDEFQDVNQMQVDLIKLLNSKNLFAVGDPRQAIYGWRGSQIKYILEFPQIFTKHKENPYEDTSVIELKTNYRSKKQIVDFFNLTIKSLNLSDLKSSKEKDEENSIFIIEQDNEMLERRFVLEAIKNSSNPKNEIFVLARTNKILDKFAEFFAQNGIDFAIKNEEDYTNTNPQKNQVTLATVHSIKGMEAKEVYLVSANNLSFPNKVVDNFVFSHMKADNDYDKEDEEERLFYVALSRAKEKLVITYTGKKSKFLTSKMLQHAIIKEKNKSLFDYANSYADSKTKKQTTYDSKNSGIIKTLLKEWRSQKSKQTNLPLYMIISNTAIDDIVKIMPQSKVELLNVKGLGSMKIAKYGEEILRIVNGN